MITRREVLLEMGEVIDSSTYIQCIEKAIIEAAKQGKRSVEYVVNKSELYDSNYDFQAILNELEKSEFITSVESADILPLLHTSLVKIIIQW